MTFPASKVISTLLIIVFPPFATLIEYGCGDPNLTVDGRPESSGRMIFFWKIFFFDIEAKKRTINVQRSKITPNFIAMSVLPFDVSRTILVVITLVFPAIFPPTIITAPTSAIARPKPRIIACDMPWLESFISARKRSLPRSPTE